ncbi:MAG: hypothetical protein K2J40_06345 [Ruminococcus sp.]|nr:hypothetical protein [Ruminococcus sp.]
MNPYFEITEQNILFRGVIYEHEYIVYCINGRVNVNTSYTMTGNGVYRCCIYYNRKLCDTISEFERMSIDKIESQAYGSYMDGAR